MDSKNSFKNIRSKYILKEILDFLRKKRLLQLIKKNKNLQNELNIGVNDYKEYYEQIEIEIIPNYEYIDFPFSRIPLKNEKYYHVYINDEENESEKKDFNKDDNIKKLKIVIDKEFKSFDFLFAHREEIEKLKFIKFNRKDINDMNHMFYNCKNLKEIDLTNFKTNNVTNMEAMFKDCSSLKKLNLNSFNTLKVTNMNEMFLGCSSLIELNINNFNTKNVQDMMNMFKGCSSLKELNLENFKTNSLKYMSDMFSECKSLRELNINNFKTRGVTHRYRIFDGCPNKLRIKIFNKYKSKRDITLWDYH